MKTETFINAVSMIDDRFLDVEIPKKKMIRRKIIKGFAATAAVLAALIFPLPALTALGVDSAYDRLYQIAPDIAQDFTPVRRSCTDNGIEMMVISAERYRNKASVCLALRDLSGTYADGDWRLDIYSINVRRGTVAHCSFSEYDAETHTAYFIVHEETFDGSDLPKGKITFTLNGILTGKETVKGDMTSVDLSSVPYEPETVSRRICGGGAYNDDFDPEKYTSDFLIPGEQSLYSPMDGVSVLGIGYVNNALHLLIKYEDNLHRDNHGDIYLIGSGNMDYKRVDYKDTENECDHFSEYIFPVDYDVLPDCGLYGEFYSAKNYIPGKWRVTFSVD